MQTTITTVNQIDISEKSIYSISTEIYDALNKYSPLVPDKLVYRKVAAVITFGGEISFDIPLGRCTLVLINNTLHVKIIHPTNPVGDFIYKVGMVKSDDIPIIMCIKSNYIDLLSPGKKDHPRSTIIAVMGNDNHLSKAELGELWYQHEVDREGHVDYFEEESEAMELYERMKENLLVHRAAEVFSRNLYNSIMSDCEKHIAISALSTTYHGRKI